jgi:hypothetical protein
MYFLLEVRFMISSGYSIDLYCDGPHDYTFDTPKATFAGETYKDCYNQAVLWGWTIPKKLKGSDTAFCKRCSKQYL